MPPPRGLARAGGRARSGPPTADETYWGRPVPGFGDPGGARAASLGLAPAAHGGNRTGRVFTGDRSGDWLFAALHRAGFANQPTSRAPRTTASRLDRRLDHRRGALRAARQPARRPRSATPACPTLARELALLPDVRVIVCLGGFAWQAAALRARPAAPRPASATAPRSTLPGGPHLLGCYHPSQQNTFTGRLTEPCSTPCSPGHEALAGPGACGGSRTGADTPMG